MKRFLISAFFVMATTSLFAQSFMPDSIRSASGGFYLAGKMDYGLSLGSEFTSVSGYGSGLGTYVTPHFFYNVSKRFRLGGGISVATTNYFNTRSWYQHEQSSTCSGNFTNAAIFVSGQYLVNDRLTLSGSAFKIFPVTRDPLPYNPFNPVSPNGAQGVDFNLDYKIGEHMHFQAGFRYTQGVNPYSADPFNNNSFLHDSYGQQSGFGSPRW